MSELFENIGVRKKVDHQLINGGEALKVFFLIMPFYKNSKLILSYENIFK